MKLKNELLKGKRLVSAYGTLVFDDEGNLTEPELTEEQSASLSELRGYEVVGEDEKKAEPKKPAKEVEEDEEFEEAKEETEEKAEGDNEPEAEPEAELNYDDMSVDELRAEAEKLELEVKGTGRKGAVVRKDLLKALKDAQ